MVVLSKPNESLTAVVLMRVVWNGTCPKAPEAFAAACAGVAPSMRKEPVMLREAESKVCSIVPFIATAEMSCCWMSKYVVPTGACSSIVTLLVQPVMGTTMTASAVAPMTTGVEGAVSSSVGVAAALCVCE